MDDSRDFTDFVTDPGEDDKHACGSCPAPTPQSTRCMEASVCIEGQCRPCSREIRQPGVQKHLDSRLQGQEDGMARVGSQPQRLKSAQHGGGAAVERAQEAAQHILRATCRPNNSTMQPCGCPCVDSH